MDFGSTEEDKLIRDNAREFVQKYVIPKRNSFSYTKKIPDEIIQRAADAGFIGFTVSEKYGGAGGTVSQMAAIVEELARGDVSMALPVYVLLLNGWPSMLEKYGSEEAKQEILPSIVKGKTYFGIGSTEPSGGSDVFLDKFSSIIPYELVFFCAAEVHLDPVVIVSKYFNPRPWFLTSKWDIAIFCKYNNSS